MLWQRAFPTKTQWTLKIFIQYRSFAEGLKSKVWLHVLPMSSNLVNDVNVDQSYAKESWRSVLARIVYQSKDVEGGAKVVHLMYRRVQFFCDFIG